MSESTSVGDPSGNCDSTRRVQQMTFQKQVRLRVLSQQHAAPKSLKVDRPALLAAQVIHLACWSRSCFWLSVCPSSYIGDEDRGSAFQGAAPSRSPTCEVHPLKVQQGGG